MDQLVTLAGCMEQYKNPAELANAWQSADERFQPDGSNNTSHLKSVKDVENQALQLLRGNEVAERSSGVVLLSSMARVCSAAHFTERCKLWIQQLVSSLQKSGPVAQAGISHLLSQLLYRASQFPSMTSELASFISPIVENLLKATPEWRPGALQCLCTCMQCYPGPCYASKDKILKALLPMLDIGEQEQQTHIANCMACLPSIGAGGGQAGKNHAEVWQKWCNLLLTTLSATMDKLVSPLEKVQTPLPGVGTGGTSGNGDSAEKLTLQEPTESEPNRSALLLTRCQSLCCCIKSLLQTAYAVAVKFPLQGILAMACRILAITSQQLITHPSMECVLLFSALPTFYASAVDLLTAVTCTCKQFLLTQSWLINQLLLQVLTWTGGDGANHTTPYSCVRIAAHRFLQAWLWVLGSGLDQHVAVKFVTHLVNAAKPPKKEDKSGLLKTSDKGKDADKDKDKLAADSSQDLDFAANAELTMSALQALSTLLLSAGSTLPPECNQAVQLFLIPLILQVNRSHLSTSTLPPPRGWWTSENIAPYGRADCRKELYNAVLCCVLADHQLGPSSMHHAISVFSEGLMDPNMEVSMLCRRALAVCNLVTHPRIRSMPPVPPKSAPPVGKRRRTADSTDNAEEEDEEAMDDDQPMTMLESMRLQHRSLAERIQCMSAPPYRTQFATPPPPPPGRAPTVTDLNTATSKGAPSSLLVRRKNRQRSAASSSPSEESPQSVVSTSTSALSSLQSKTPAVAATSKSAVTSESAAETDGTPEADNAGDEPVICSSPPAPASMVTVKDATASKRRATTEREASITLRSAPAVRKGATETSPPQLEPSPKRTRRGQSTQSTQPKRTRARSQSEKASAAAAGAKAAAPEASGEVTSMLGSFVDSGPDSDAADTTT